MKQESLRKPKWVECVEIKRLARVAYDKLKKVKAGRNDTTTFQVAIKDDNSLTLKKKKNLNALELLILIKQK